MTGIGNAHPNFAKCCQRVECILIILYTEDAVSKSSPIRPSRYRREKLKCWSQIALAGMGEKRFPGPC